MLAIALIHSIILLPIRDIFRFFILSRTSHHLVYWPLSTTSAGSRTRLASALVAEPSTARTFLGARQQTFDMSELGVNPKLPTWDGDWRTFMDYRLACYLEYDGLKKDEQVTLAPRLTRNLTGKAWEACSSIDREKLRQEGGLDYLLSFLKEKRGKQQVDILGEAFEKYFQSSDVLRRDKESLNDYEQRLSIYTRDIDRALAELSGSEGIKVPTEIYGWFLLNKHLRLEPSDVATLKSQTASYKLADVQTALRKMWGGDSLVIKDQERKRLGKAYLNISEEYDAEDETQQSDGGVWWNDDLPEHQENPDEERSEVEIWFEEALAAFQDQPEDEVILANFQEAKKAFITRTPGRPSTRAE